MNFDPKTYIALAEHLNDTIDDLPDGVGAESARRTALNRYYYSISTQTHFFLVNNIDDTAYKAIRNKSHKLLRDHLYAVNTKMAKLLTADLKRLYKWRWEADYVYPVSMKILKLMIDTQKHLATQAQKKLDALLSTFP